MVSVLGEEVSRCQLAGCTLVLVSSPLGLRVQWCDLTQPPDTTTDRTLGSAVVTKVQCSGKLYPVLLDPKLEIAAFGRDLTVNPRAAKSEGIPTCAMVACGSGLVAGVHWKTPGLCVNLCHSVQAIVWAGVLKVSKSSSVVAVADKGGTLSIGTATPSTSHRTTPHHNNTREGQVDIFSLQWHTLTLPAPPRTFLGQNDCLIFSDGDALWLGQVSSNSSRGLADVQWRRTSIRGVIRIESSGDNKVDMFTCDGRKYSCQWDEIKARGEDDGKREDSKSGNQEAPHTLESVMTGIQRCSEIMNVEGKEIATLDLYLRQLSLTHRFVDKSKSPIFSSTVRIESSLERRGSYFAVVHLKKLRGDDELGGNWWSLLMVNQEAKEVTYLSLKLDEESLKSELCLTVPLPPSDTNLSLQGTTLVSYLVLEHPVSATPVCRIFACQTTVDAINFLTRERTLGSTSLSPLNANPEGILSGTVVSATRINKDSRNYPVPPCKVSTMFRASEEVLETLSSVLSPDKPIDTNSSNNSSDHKITAFHPKGRIDMSWQVAEDLISVTVEGTNPSLVLSVRAALERRVSELPSHTAPTTLGPAVLRRAHLTQRVLRFEGSEASTVAALAHLHNTTSSLLSLLPYS